MDNAILKKRLNTYKSAKGTLKDVSNDVVFEVLRAWENWPGTAADLYRELGLSPPPHDFLGHLIGVRSPVERGCHEEASKV